MTEKKPEIMKFSKLKQLAFCNSSKLTCVIMGGNLHRWVGFGFVDEGPASDEQKLEYPTVVD